MMDFLHQVVELSTTLGLLLIIWCLTLAVTHDIAALNTTTKTQHQQRQRHAQRGENKQTPTQRSKQQETTTTTTTTKSRGEGHEGRREEERRVAESTRIKRKAAEKRAL
jgi:hypothetical protein